MGPSATITPSDSDRSTSEALSHETSGPAHAACSARDSDRRERAHKGHICDERIELGQQIATRRRPRSEQTDDRIEEAEEYELRRRRAEILSAFGQGIPQIPYADLSHDGSVWLDAS
jgi:hypothetical protein